MKRIVNLGLVSMLLATGISLGQPRLVGPSSGGYHVGDTVSAELWVFDSQMNKVLLSEIVRPDTKVVVLLLFGGGASKVPQAPFRGGLWCRDSFDDLGVERAMVRAFAGRPVQFIPIAVGPVLNSARYGFGDDVFLAGAVDEEQYREAARKFIAATEREKASGILPFETIYYDPQALLLIDAQKREDGPDWAGKLKWYQDPRKYGTPTIWILDGRRTVLSEPFWGNDYDSEPPQVNYGFKDLQAAIEAGLSE